MHLEKQTIKFVYFGSGYFSRLILSSLCEKGFFPQLVLTLPDKPKGRGYKYFPTEVGKFAAQMKIPLIKTDKLSRDLSKEINQMQCAFLVVVDYGKKIPSGFFLSSLPFSICLHPSLLPRYRGASPLQMTILNGDETGGVTVFKINERIDEGEIILQKEIPLEGKENALTLAEKLKEPGGVLLIEAMQKIKTGNYQLIPQDEAGASYAPKIKKQDARINWSKSAFELDRLIRAFYPWPVAYTYFRDRCIKILEATPIEGDFSSPGEIIKIAKEGIYVNAGEGVLCIKTLKPQGRPQMSAWDFSCGWRIKIKDKFS